MESEEPWRDERADIGKAATSDPNGHHADNYWGSHGHSAKGTQPRRRRKHRQRNGAPKANKVAAAESGPDQGADPEEDGKKKIALAPGRRIQFLLDEGTAGEAEEASAPPPLFTEMSELHAGEWRETARWVKFEEDVEEGGNRWSKPHVATLSLHSLFELRSLLMKGTVILDMDAVDLPQIVELMLDKMVAAHQVEFRFRDEVRDAVLLRHTHQYEHAKHPGGLDGAHSASFISTVRSLADIGRNFSHGNNVGDKEKAAPRDMTGPPTITVDGASNAGDSQINLAKMNPELGKTDSEHHSKDGAAKPKKSVGSFFRSNSRSILHSPSDAHLAAKGNHHFMKKLPHDCEASNVLIGELDFLSHHTSAFIRLSTPTLLGDLTEVPVPTRFLFLLLGPKGHAAQFHEIGRAIATLMSDEIFHDVAYKAHNRADLLDGIDEFLDQVTVLPPGEWDPDIRIEPPTSIPSQEKRKHVGEDKSGGGGGGDGGDDNGEEAKEEEGGHGNDPALKRTGRLFGGLVLDIKRKAPFYLSDFKDALNMQCFATFIFMYFALLAPIVTFGGLLSEATGRNMAAMENLLSGAICGITYHLFSGQPLTIIGSTGPVLVFETIIYETCRDFKLEYMPVRWWINFWMAVILMLMVATDASALVSYITRFTEESFATLIAVIFVYEAIVKLIDMLDHADVITYFGPVGWEVDSFEKPLNRCICTGSAENFTNYDKLAKIASHKKIDNMTSQPWYSDHVGMDMEKNVSFKFATINLDVVPLKYCEAFHGELDGNDCYPMTDVFLVSALLMIGTFFIAFTLKRCKNSCYFPTWVRQTLSDFSVIIAIAVMVGVDAAFGLETAKLNVPERFEPTNPEARGWVIHPFGGNPWWTLLVAIPPALLGCVLIFMDQQITAVIVNRKENKLKKKCGYHLDLFILSILILITGVLGLPIYVAATVLSINHVNALGVESESRAPGEKPTFIGVREQRATGILTFIFIGLSVLMTKVLKFISMPVLYGVFMYMGIMALNGIQLIDRLLLILMPMKYQPDYMYLRNVPILRVHLFTFFQTTCLVLLWVIKSIKKTKIAFPVMLVVMIGVRKLMEYVFTAEELGALDDQMPEFHLRKKADDKKKADTGAEGELAELKAVKTQGHLHIPMASGNIMKIPLAAINEEDSTNALNISEEIKGSSIWKHIDSESNFNVTGDTPAGSNSNKMSPEDLEDDSEAITIKIDENNKHE